MVASKASVAADPTDDSNNRIAAPSAAREQGARDLRRAGSDDGPRACAGVQQQATRAVGYQCGGERGRGEW